MVIECLKWAVVILIPLLCFIYFVQPKSADSAGKDLTGLKGRKKENEANLPKQAEENNAPHVEVSQVQISVESQQPKPEDKQQHIGEGTQLSKQDKRVLMGGIGFVIAMILSSVGTGLVNSGHDIGGLLMGLPWLAEAIIVFGCKSEKNTESKPKKEGLGAEAGDGASK